MTWVSRGNQNENRIASCGRVPELVAGCLIRNVPGQVSVSAVVALRFAAAVSWFGGQAFLHPGLHIPRRRAQRRSRPARAKDLLTAARWHADTAGDRWWDRQNDQNPLNAERELFRELHYRQVEIAAIVQTNSRDPAWREGFDAAGWATVAQRVESTREGRENAFLSDVRSVFEDVISDQIASIERDNAAQDLRVPRQNKQSQGR